MSSSEDNKSPAKAIEKNEIQTHNFEKAKNGLRKFSEKIPSSTDFPTVTPNTFFGLLNRNVTGSELNKVTKEVQKCIAATNVKLIGVIKEFEQVYQTFEALDKDYIQGLIAGIKAAEAASNQAMKAATKAFEAVEESKKNTNDIECLIETQSIIIDKLVMFKKRIEDIPNIDNVSTMWEDIQGLIKQVMIMRNAIADNDATAKERFVEQDRHISKQNEELVLLINKNRVDLSDVLVDANKKQSEQYGNLSRQIEIIHNEIKINQAAINERFVTQNSQLLQKIKIAYAVAGAFGAITLTHVVLAVLGIV